MSFKDILKIVNENFAERKMVDFEKEGLHFEIAPLSSKEEVIVLESCKEVDETEYIESLKRCTLACAIKKLNDLEIDKDEIEYEDGKFKSKFLYMKEYLSKWPSSIIDVLFEAYTHMSKEAENKVQDSVKFERMALSDTIEDEEDKNKFRRIVEDTSEGLSEIEKLKEKVDNEIATADAARENTDQVAE